MLQIEVMLDHTSIDQRVSRCGLHHTSVPANMLMHLQPSLQCHANSCHHLCCVTPDDMEEYSPPAAPWSPPDDDLLPPLVAMDSSAGATLLAAPCYCKPCNCDVPLSWLTPVLQPEIASLRYVAAASDVPRTLMSLANHTDAMDDDVTPLADEMMSLVLRDVRSWLPHCPDLVTNDVTLQQL